MFIKKDLVISIFKFGLVCSASIGDNITKCCVFLCNFSIKIVNIIFHLKHILVWFVLIKYIKGLYYTLICMVCLILIGKEVQE